MVVFGLSSLPPPAPSCSCLLCVTRVLVVISVQWHWTVLGLVKYLEQFSKIFTLDSARTCVTIVTRSCVTAVACVSSLVTVTSVMKNRQQKVLKSLQSFVVTNITSNLISYILWSSVDSFSLESVIFLPLLHLGRIL